MDYDYIQNRVVTLQHAKPNDTPIKSMSSHELNGHFEELQNLLENQRYLFDDCFAHSGDIRFQILPQEKFDNYENYPNFLTAKQNGEIYDINIALRVRSRQDGRWLVIPTVHAWKQIQKTLGFSKRFFNKIIQEKNPQLLVENLNFLLDCLDEQDLLLRMISFSKKNIETARSGKDANAAPFLLRAFLNPRFCRMDNIYLCHAMKKAFESLTEEIGDIKFSVENNGGNMVVDVQFLNEQNLTKLNEKYLSGIRLIASETGSYKHIIVQTTLTRLICLNGMTVGEQGKVTRISYYFDSHKMGMKRFQNLPTFPMPDDFQEQQTKIELLISEVIRACHGEASKSLKQFQERVNRLMEDAEKAEQLDHQDVAVALRYILLRMGLNSYGGIAVKKILEYYDKECSEYNAIGNPPNVAWLLINAITRYATHYMMTKDLDIAQVIQSRIHSHALNPSYITWNNIWEQVKNKREKTKSAKPPVPV